ncbi:hypothetical protein TI39_contig4173g00039 [Zymoseptoria brevis]|uniref:Uncharacterized protein n=1 Tax=Zymoseptoria brevis TaxID=1047168 RepID=A0A0F4GEI4_9PEZI|nr:hypothetical protein TI39_contig4173g00039 [Zymoseptoria brevis]
MASNVPPPAQVNAAFDRPATILLRSSRSAASLPHQESPHLSLHDYHKWQHSPLLSHSPELEYKKVRRKSSIADLSASPQQGDFQWAPSSNLPPSLHSFSQRDLPPRFHPHPPTTPTTRTYPASPSLSSTVTTLQSTPTHTPILRDDTHFVQRRIDEGTALKEPLRTKRKFDSLKKAKRFPRQAASGNSGSLDGGLWEVYAAVFDVSEEQGGIAEESVGIEEDLEASPEQQIQRAENLTHAYPAGRAERSVRFEGVDTKSRGGFHSTSTSSSATRQLEKDPTATSIYSLSKFEFPAPPGLDNWTRTTGKTLTHIARQDIETPGEIDGLLDDYYNEETESQRSSMSYNHLTGEPSQSSPRVPSENSKSLRTLYDDADTARRNILGVHNEPARPSPVVYSRSANQVEYGSSSPAGIREGKGKSPALQQQHSPVRRVGTNPFRRLPSLSRSSGAEDVVGERGQPQSVPRFSDPFDLTVSDNGNIVELRSIDGILGRERVAAAATDDGVVAVPASEETDAAMRSLLNKYDHTRQSLPPQQSESPSIEEIERGLGYGGCAGEEGDFGFYTPVPASTPFRTSYYGINALLPTAPPPVYGGRRISRSSELPTSEQTYGETNQLLMITPEMQRRAAQKTRMAPNPQSHAHHQHPRLVNSPSDDFHTAAGLATMSAPHMFRSSSVYPATENGSAWQTEAEDSEDDGFSYANTSTNGSTIRLSHDEAQPAHPEVQSPRGFFTRQELIDDFNRSRVEKGDPSIRYEVREAMRILQDKVFFEDRGVHLRPDHMRVDKETQIADMSRLEELRQQDHTIIREASERLCEIAIQNTTSKSSFSKVRKLLRMNKPDPDQEFYRPFRNSKRPNGYHRSLTDNDSFDGSFSSRRGLVSPARPAMRSNLEFSESNGTFITIRDVDSPFEDRDHNGWYPNDPNPTARALNLPTPSDTAAASALGLPTPIHGPTTTTRIPLQFRSTTRVDRVAPRPAIESQIELQPLRLIKNTNATRRSPGRAYTNAELIEREPNWTEFPSNPHVPRRQPTLVPFDNVARNEQKSISETCALLSTIFPLTALAFAMGGFDWWIRRKTSGRILTMGNEEKRLALCVYFPLSLVGYAILVIAVVLATKLSR